MIEARFNRVLRRRHPVDESFRVLSSLDRLVIGPATGGGPRE